MRIRTLKSAIALSLMLVPLSAFSQWGGMGMNMNRDSLNKVAEADYANMMEQLGIKEMKPGRNPNTTDVTQHPNYDELIGNPYCIYPELLVTNSGKQVKNAKMWNKVRRPELVKTFEEEIYGCIPENIPSVDWQVTDEQKAKLGNTAEVLYLISNPDKHDEPFATAQFDVQHYKMIPYKNVGNGVNELKANLEKELKVFYCI